jgi:hypothetical protein
LDKLLLERFESIWPTAVGFNDSVDLSQKANGLVERDNDALVLLSIAL